MNFKQFLLEYRRKPEVVKEFNCQSNDIDSYYEILDKNIPKGYIKKSLGKIGGDDIFLITRKILTKGPKVLFVSGFHGEEVGGPWGMLHFIVNNKELLEKTNVNISFIPIVNVTGFEHEKRGDIYGQAPNSGFIKHDPKEKLSKEGHLLVNNIKLLKPLSTNCFISFHEVEGIKTFKTYAFNKEGKVDPLDKLIVKSDGGNKGDENMKLEPNKPETIRTHEGVVLNHYDGTFEDYMFEKEGVQDSCTTESPETLPLQKRIDINSNVMMNVLKYFQK